MAHFSLVDCQIPLIKFSVYRFPGTIPTIGDALTALDELTNNLIAKLKQISDISAELLNKDQIGLENIQEVCGSRTVTFLTDAATILDFTGL